MLKDNPEIGVSTSTINSLVLECNDGSINKIQDRVLDYNNILDIKELIKRAVYDKEKGMGVYQAEIDTDAMEFLA